MSSAEWIQGVEEANKKMRAEVAADRLHQRVVGQLPLDRDQAKTEMTDERRAMLSSRPTSRRWRRLEKFDDAVDRAAQKHMSALARLQEAEQRLRDAPGHDAATLARWLDGGERGPRPDATAPERRRERAAGGICRYCGKPAGELDFVVALSRGGPASEANAVASCRRCNGSKGAATAVRAAPPAFAWAENVAAPPTTE